MEHGKIMEDPEEQIPASQVNLDSYLHLLLVFLSCWAVHPAFIQALETTILRFLEPGSSHGVCLSAPTKLGRFRQEKLGVNKNDKSGCNQRKLSSTNT